MDNKVNTGGIGKTDMPSKNGFCKIIGIIVIISLILCISFIIPKGIIVLILILMAPFIIPAIFVGLGGTKTISIDADTGAFWKIKNEFFIIKAFEIDAILRISSMEIGLVPSNSEWIPVEGGGAYCYPRMLQGKCRLKNNKQALVVQELGYREYLVILAENVYYLIGYPSNDKLYIKLLEIGAKDKNFNHSEVNQ